MAKQEIIIDDISQDEGAREVIFSVDGLEYAIDLNDKHLTALKTALKPYIAAATPLGRVIRSSGRKPKASSGDGPDPKLVREWALKHGHQIGDRGRIKQDVMDAYLAAHQRTKVLA